MIPTIWLVLVMLSAHFTVTEKKKKILLGPPSNPRLVADPRLPFQTSSVTASPPSSFAYIFLTQFSLANSFIPFSSNFSDHSPSPSPSSKCFFFFFFFWDFILTVRIYSSIFSLFFSSTQPSYCPSLPLLALP